MSKWFFEKFLVELSDFGVLMRFADGHIGILLVDGFFTFGPDLPVCRDRLATAAQATTRTSHDFNKMIVCFAFLHILDQPFRMSQSVGDRAFQLNPFEEFPFRPGVFNFDRCFPDFTFGSPDGNDIQVLKRHFPSGHYFISRS